MSGGHYVLVSWTDAWAETHKQRKQKALVQRHKFILAEKFIRSLNRRPIGILLWFLS